MSACWRPRCEGRGRHSFNITLKTSFNRNCNRTYTLVLLPDLSCRLYEIFEPRPKNESLTQRGPVGDCSVPSLGIILDGLVQLSQELANERLHANFPSDEFNEEFKHGC